jgi:hypothetical protein
MSGLKPGPISEAKATAKEEADSSAALRNDKPRKEQGQMLIAEVERVGR